MNHIHYFNPGHENAVLNRSPSYTAPASQTTLMRELASVPAWYAPPNHFVLVGDGYNVDYHKSLQDMGFSIPSLLFNKQLKEYNGAEVCLWGVSPQAIRLFEGLNRDYSLNLKVPNWDEKYIYLNSRKVAHDVLSDLKSISPRYDAISLPVFCDDVASIERELAGQQHSFLVKSPYSSSGRGLLWLPTDGLTRVEYQILQGMFKKQGRVSLERVYDKQIDFAMEFMCDGSEAIAFAGYSLFSTNEKGAYQGNYLCPQSEIVDKITRYVDLSILENTKSFLLDLLSKYYGSAYRGCIGVDMMIVLDKTGYVLHPCVEINMRYNMGFLSIKLFENFVSSTSRGQYFLDCDATGHLKSEHDAMQKEYPLVVENGKVKSGYLSLSAVDDRTKYRAYILVLST